MIKEYDMTIMNLPEHLKDAKLLFEGRKFDLYQKEILGRNGHPVVQDIIYHLGSVVILPFINTHRLLLIKNYRPALAQTLYELPAGTLEEGEEPFNTARRELIEETGYQSDHVEFLFKFYTSPGYTMELMHVFLARDLHHVGQQLEQTEQIEVEEVSLKDAISFIKSGQIIDGKTIASILYLTSFYPEYTNSNFID